MVIDLPYERRKVEGSRKYRRRERVPKAGSRREETITEPVNSCIGEFHTIVGQMMPAVWNVAEPQSCLDGKRIDHWPSELF